MGLGSAALQTYQKRELIPGPPFAANAADNGLSVDPVTAHIVLGQAIGAPGNPAALLSDREIPTGAFILDLREGAVGAVGALAVLAATADNSQGKRVAIFAQLGQAGLKEAIHAANFAVNADGCVMTTAADLNSADIGSYGNGFATLKLRNTTILRSIGGVGAGPNVAVISGNTGFFSIYTDLAGVLTELERFLAPVQAALNFPLTAAQTSSDLTIAVPGAADGDAVQVGVPVGSIVANSSYWGFVSAPGVVTVRFNNYSAAGIDPAVGNFTVAVTKLLPP